LCFGLASIGSYLNALPEPEVPLAIQQQILENLSAYRPSNIPPNETHFLMDSFQARLMELHQKISARWFYPDFEMI
jgi:hypothetical protein